MKGQITTLLNWLAGDPRRRSAVTVAFALVGNLLAGALIFDITIGGVLVGARILTSYYAYGLAVLYFLYVPFQSTVFNMDSKTYRPLRKNNPYEYVQQKCLPQYVEHCKKLIEEGKLDEYHQAQERLPGKEK